MSEYEVIDPTAWQDSTDLSPTISPTPAPSASNDIQVTYFELDDTFKTIPDDGFDGMTPLSTGYISTINYPYTYDSIATSGVSDYIGALFEANLNFDTPGIYDLCVDSSDGSKLYIDNEMKIDNNGIHGMHKGCFMAFFNSGSRKITIEYFEYNGWGGIVVTWKKAGDNHYETIPAQAWNPSYIETEQVHQVMGLIVGTNISCKEN